MIARNERALTSDEILSIGTKYLENEDFKSCSEVYRNQLKDFLKDTKNLVDKVFKKYQIDINDKKTPEGSIEIN